jgi:hydroxyacylglutathione hydrolase
MDEVPAPALQVAIIPVTPFKQNCSLVWCTRTMEAAFIDPGGEPEKLLAAIIEHRVTLTKIILTHGHLDHAGGCAAIKRATGVPIEGPHHDDRWLMDSIPDQAAKYGVSGLEAAETDRWLKDGDIVTLGALSLEVRHCPGHTPGHVVILHPQSHIAFVGDVLFAGSVGTTRLPRGDYKQLVNSITRKLWPYGDDILFVPGHGQTSTFGWERRTNPFVSDIALGWA